MKARRHQSYDRLKAWGYTRVVYPVLHPQIYGGLGRRMMQLEGREHLPLEENRKRQWLERVIGRTTDLFQLANGDKIPGVSLTNRVLQACPSLKKLQILQETLTDFAVRYVPGSAFSPADLIFLQNKLRGLLAGDLNWRFERVHDIPDEPSGKTRFRISRVVKPAAPEIGRSGAV